MNALLPKVLAAAAGLMLLAAAPAHAEDPDLVRTGAGLVRGSTTDGIRSFQGIPYAAPPTGDLRWRATEPALPWEGVREAVEPGSPCARPGQEPGTVAGSEDCLFLNVHAPADAAEPLPVMVFLHGGGLSSGQGADYDPVRVVGHGVVVVTVNYRLGALGWLAHPDLDDPYAGNFGLADQQAALAWVREEIGEFGGDAGNVTLWGQSAGGRSVCALLAASGAQGLYDKAIVQSAPCGNAVVEVDEAQRRGLAHAESLGCTDDVEACLRSADLADLVALGGEEGLYRRAADLPWSPVAGTEVLPLQPLTAMRRGLAAEVPLLHGGTSDEMRSMVLKAGPVTEERYPELVTELFGERAVPPIVERYPVGDFEAPAVALATLLTDYGGQLGICSQPPALDAASRHAPVYAYEFAEPAPPFGDFPLGAHHSADLGYFFDLPFPGWQRPEGDQAALSEAMIGHWTAFAATGDPGWDEWRGKALTLSVADTSMANLTAGHHCGFWRGFA